MTVIPSLMVGDTAMPTDTFTITGGAYGSTGSLTATSSIKALADAGFDLVAASVKSPGSLPVDVWVTAPASGKTHLFSGEYVSGSFDYDDDSVTISARDWAGPLVDQKRALTSVVGGKSGALAPDEAKGKGISTQNQKLSQIVTQIAEQFSLIPDLRLNSDISNADADVGVQFGNTNDTVMTAIPQTLWGVLTRLARQSGNIVYVTAEKHLVFGAAGAGLETLALTYRQTAGGLPLLKLRVDHNPRRNMTFRVVVLSYDPTLAQLTKGQAFVIGSNYSGDDGSTVHAGAWGGAQATQISKAIGGDKKKAIPLYTYHIDGLTAAQAQSRAEAIAADISKRELVASCEAAVIPDLAPGQSATLAGKINPEFASHTYYVTAYRHRFRVGTKGRGAQFSTSFSMLDRQPAGKGKSVTPKTAAVG